MNPCAPREEEHAAGSIEQLRAHVSATARLLRDIQPDADPAVASHAVSAALHGLACQVALACETLEDRDIRGELEEARAVFRQSPFMARLLTWPRGYQGDFETIEYLIAQQNKVPQRSGAHYLEEWALRLPICQQHRNKVQAQAHVLLEVAAASRDTAAPGRVLAIACGGGQDFEAALPVLERANCRFVLNDIDPGALERCQSRLGPIAARTDYIEGNALTKLSTLAALGPYDLVLAGGLFDYLARRQVEFLLKQALKRLLRPGGVLVFTNLAKGNPYAAIMEYFVDWKVVERDHGEMASAALAAGFPKDGIDIRREPSQLAWIARLTAKAA